MSERESEERDPELEKVEPGVESSARDRQRPAGEAQSQEATSLSGDDPDDPLREEAAERARRAVEPGERRE